jgi:hypothetical protein
VKLNSGKLVILGMLAVALAAAAFAWWRQYHLGRRSLEYWGAEGARLIRAAPQVELVKLSGAAAEAPPNSLRRDVSQARGLVHARQALISDASFLWGDKPSTTPAWEYALVFRDGSREFTVLLDLSRDLAGSGALRAPVRLGPTLSQGLRQFLAEQITPGSDTWPAHGASASRAAAMVVSMSSSVCAAETNSASYWLQGK